MHLMFETWVKEGRPENQCIILIGQERTGGLRYVNSLIY